MRAIDRIKLINQIALKLQEQMTYTEIDSYLPAFGINCKDYQPSTNNKKDGLKLYGISGFVAHVDIEPSKQW